LLNSSPYYAQANGQAEASNKILIRLIKKKIEEKPRKWHEVLSEALWTHRTALHDVTKVTPFELVYGQEAMLPVEINLQTHRVAGQDILSAVEYVEWMMGRIDEVPESRLWALGEIEELVWKMILPLGTRNSMFGKWSPSWEGPYRISGIVLGNAYFVETLEGKRLAKSLNVKYLKKYFPSVWQEA
jgi:hypothetical protein